MTGEQEEIVKLWAQIRELKQMIYAIQKELKTIRNQQVNNKTNHEESKEYELIREQYHKRYMQQCFPESKPITRGENPRPFERDTSQSKNL